jgi:hypothetical protein
MPKFTKEEIIAEAKKRCGAPVCIDSIDDALECETLGEAVNLILFETAMWDSPTGNPFDTINS